MKVFGFHIHSKSHQLDYFNFIMIICRKHTVQKEGGGRLVRALTDGGIKGSVDPSPQWKKYNKSTLNKANT